MTKTEKNTIVCSRCRDDFSSDKEIKIEGLIICIKCSQQIVARCYNCRWPIYDGEPNYEITPNWSVEYIFGANQSEKVVQCDWCYQKWLIKQKKKKGLWRQRKWILGFCATLLLSTILFLLYPTLEKNWIELYKKDSYLPWVVCICLLVLSSIIVFMLYKVISVEFISRYEIGKAKKDKKRKRKDKKTKQKSLK